MIVRPTRPSCMFVLWKSQLSSGREVPAKNTNHCRSSLKGLHSTSLILNWKQLVQNTGIKQANQQLLDASGIRVSEVFINIKLLEEESTRPWAHTGRWSRNLFPRITLMTILFHKIRSIIPRYTCTTGSYQRSSWSSSLVNRLNNILHTDKLPPSYVNNTGKILLSRMKSILRRKATIPDFNLGSGRSTASSNKYTGCSTKSSRLSKQ